MRFVQAEGQTEPGRPSGRLNRAEAEVVVDEVSRAMKQDPSATIGVVTPFSPQAHLIESLLKSKLSREQWEAAQLRIGTAHKFQGDERRVMIASLVLSHGAPVGSAAWVEKERNLLNVAVSRAQQLLVVVGDAPRISNLPVPTLHELIRHAAKEAHQVTTGLSHDVLAAARNSLLTEFTAADDLTLAQDIDAEGYPFPLALSGQGAEPVYLDIDAYDQADDHATRYRQLIARDDMLASAKFAVIRFPAWQCLENPDEVLQQALRRLDRPPPR
jgi:AAA domain